jgi:plastocyanin
LRHLLCAAPAYLCRCVGAFVLLASLLSCERTPFTRARTLDVGGDTIQLAPGVDIHDVQIRNSAEAEFVPASIAARSGDVVRFTTTDSRTHLIEFDEISLPGNARSLFEGKTQVRSPPLLVQGAAWVVSLEDAPAGTYTFLCSTHGSRGQLTIR